jgi:thiosulfate reductase cytochrome b subunit
MAKKRVYIYFGFERFWHWMQALLVILLALTGFVVHFGWSVIDYEQAVIWHRTLAWAFVILITFAIFWHLTTGEWKQYVPGGNVIAMALYYSIGMFRKEEKPVKKTQLSKLNPLQKLAYLGLKILIIPILVTTGFLYYYFNDFTDIGAGHRNLALVAKIHTFAAFLMIAFMFAHIYLTTTGHTLTSNIKAMVTGWEELDVEEDAP